MTTLLGRKQQASTLEKALLVDVESNSGFDPENSHDRSALLKKANEIQSTSKTHKVCSIKHEALQEKLADHDPSTKILKQEEHDASPKDEVDTSVSEVATIAGSLLFCVEINEGMLGTFFNSWCLQRGLTFAQLGHSIGFLSIGILCMAPCAPHLILKWGAHRVQYYASWAFIVVRSSYIVLPVTPVAMLFPVMCSLFFGMGLVAILSESAASAWTLTSVDPDKRTQAMGILLGTRSSANLLAPAFGGCLYGLGGFYLPIISGVLVFALMLIKKRKRILAEARPANTFSTKSGSILRSKRVFMCQAINAIVVLALLSCGMFFQPYLQSQYGLPTWKYGLMVSAFSLIFIAGAQIAAYIEKTFGGKIGLFVGTVAISLGLLLFGPSPYLTFLPAPAPSSVWLPCSALALFFFGVSVTFSILSPMTLNYATKDGWGENDAAAQNGMINVVFGGCAVGLGGALGGSLVQSMGVGLTGSCFAVALPSLVMTALALLKRWDRASEAALQAHAFSHRASIVYVD